MVVRIKSNSNRFHSVREFLKKPPMIYIDMKLSHVSMTTTYIYTYVKLFEYEKNVPYSNLSTHSMMENRRTHSELFHARKIWLFIGFPLEWFGCIPNGFLCFNGSYRNNTREIHWLHFYYSLYISKTADKFMHSHDLFITMHSKQY